LLENFTIGGGFGEVFLEFSIEGRLPVRRGLEAADEVEKVLEFRVVLSQFP
jgi:hypothetical protein